MVGASLNTTGSLRVRATAVGADTALAQIVALVQQAQNSKAPGQRLADRAAFWLVLLALIGGALTFTAWYLGTGSVQTAFSAGGDAPEHDWKLSADDVAQVVFDLLGSSARSLPSRVEIRPSKPK